MTSLLALTAVALLAGGALGQGALPPETQRLTWVRDVLACRCSAREAPSANRLRHLHMRQGQPQGVNVHYAESPPFALPCLPQPPLTHLP
jgi:hypothetical protein